MKYNYVIFGTSDDYYQVSYSELYDKKYVKCIMNYLDLSNKTLLQLFRLHYSPQLNSIISLPFKCIWNRFIFKNTFQDEKPICFLFFARNSLCLPSVIRYLKRTYPNSKCVAFWQDLVSQVNMADFDNMRQLLDLCVSFDQSDAKRYNMIYHPLVYSPFKLDYPNLPKSDVYFVGKAKDRLKTILKCYLRFKESGLKCDFHIVGVKKDERQYEDEIDYCDSMSYIDNLRHIQATNCMLEVMQGGGSGYTLRYAEAIMYDKKIITNNKMIQSADFYSSDKIHVFSDVDEVDVEFLKKNPIFVDYGCKSQLLPSHFLKFLDQLF